MKVIDLLNKIANGEKCPKKLIKGEYTLKFIDDYYPPYYALINNNNGVHLGEFYFNISNLNDEVEIIEEPKEIEKPKNYEDFESIDDYIEHLRHKIVELIDVINELKKENK